MKPTFYDECQRLIHEGAPFVSVTLVDREGSVPQDVGSKIIVGKQGLIHGTVGGGKVEARAIEHAITMLSSKAKTELVQWNLTTDIGMTCGGRLRLFFEVNDQASWVIAIFGAGHISQSLTRLLATLPCQVTCIDSREEWLDRLSPPTKVIHTDDMLSVIDTLDDDTYILSMTQGHSKDFPNLQRIWQSGRRFPYIGVIGSKSKSIALRRELRAAGMPDGAIEFHCPIGLPIGTNHPGEIAISIAAQLIQIRDQRQRVED